MDTALEIAPARAAASLKGMVIIYALSALLCFLLNVVARAMPEDARKLG